MIKAVLLDLDDTLLHIDIDNFTKSYMQSLGAFAAQRHPMLTSEKVQTALVSAVRATVRNIDPAQTNASIVSAALATAIDMPPAAIDTLMADFYGESYAQLGNTAQPVEGAVSLIEHLLEIGVRVVIATNPLFPRAALLGRLAWAGIDLDKTPVALLTSVDIMHFTKPNPHYYEEILARIGVEAEDALMVGDDIKNDMMPAASAGLSTYWITWDRALPDGVTPNGKGTLHQLEQMIHDGWLQTLIPKPRTAEQVAPRMLGNVAALGGIIAEMNPALWNAYPDPREWSPLEIVCHLRDSESAIQRPRLLRILREDNPFLVPPPAPPAPHVRDLSGEDGNAAYAAFAAERAKTLAMLAELSADDWTRPARHSIFGPTSLLEMAHFTARHDRLHILQLCETIGHCAI